jgi:hypothetical protein
MNTKSRDLQVRPLAVIPSEPRDPDEVNLNLLRRDPSACARDDRLI